MKFLILVLIIGVVSFGLVGGLDADAISSDVITISVDIDGISYDIEYDL